LVVGAILLQASAQNVGQVRDLVTVANESLGTMTNGTALYVTNCKVLSSVIIFNATGDVTIPAGNYTLTNNVVYNGQEAVKVDPLIDAGGRALGYNKGTATYDGVCQPLTYDPSSGGRAVAYVIIIMFALAIAVVALTPTLRSGVMEALGR
jgi:hypothetical protein